MAEAYFKLTKKVLDSDIAADAVLLGIWTKLIGKANWKESTVNWAGRPRKLERGQILISLRNFAEGLNISKSMLHRKLQYLADPVDPRIAMETHRDAGTLITLLKYSEHQDTPGFKDDQWDTDETRSEHERDYQNKEINKSMNQEAVEEAPQSDAKAAPADDPPLGIFQPIPELRGDPDSGWILDPVLTQVCPQAQRGWLSRYRDVEWVRGQLVDAINYYRGRGDPDEDWGLRFFHWLKRERSRPKRLEVVSDPFDFDPDKEFGT